MEREKWIQKVLESHIGMTKVNPSDDLFSKIEAKIHSEKVSDKAVWLVAASLTILIALNFGIISKSKQEKLTTIELSKLTYNTNNQLY